MSMLAEPRRKQKFSDNPRGLAWSKDENKFGQKLMESMGWKSGKGLGAKEDGETSHVKISLKSDTRGVGCTKKHADKWLAHQDDFSSLLQSLNSGKAHAAGSDTELLQMEASSKRQKGYRKFSRGKDLSSRSKHELNCVFGKRSSKSEGNTPRLPLSKAGSGSEEEDTEAIHGVQTITSSQDVQQYFAEKMAALKRMREGNNAPELTPKQEGEEHSGAEVKTEPTEGEERKGAVVHWSYGDDVDVKVESPERNEGAAEGERRKDKTKKKKKDLDDVENDQTKKSKKRKADDDDETSNSTGSGEDTKKEKKKSKKSKTRYVEEVEEDQAGKSSSQDQEGERTAKKKKKSKKSKPDHANSEDDDIEAAETKEKKKRKKAKRKMPEEEVNEDVCDEPAKKKNKKAEESTERGDGERKKKKKKREENGSDECSLDVDTNTVEADKTKKKKRKKKNRSEVCE